MKGETASAISHLARAQQEKLALGNPDHRVRQPSRIGQPPPLSDKN
jgi:hypothetical protein